MNTGGGAGGVKYATLLMHANFGGGERTFYSCRALPSDLHERAYLLWPFVHHFFSVCVFGLHTECAGLSIFVAAGYFNMMG